METTEMSKRYASAREALQLNQEDVAVQTQLNKKTISFLETGKTKKPNMKYVNFLVELGIDYNWLINGKGEMFSQKITNNSIMENIDSTITIKPKRTEESHAYKEMYEQTKKELDKTKEELLEALRVVFNLQKKMMMGEQMQVGMVGKHNGIRGKNTSTNPANMCLFVALMPYIIVFVRDFLHLYALVY